MGIGVNHALLASLHVVGRSVARGVVMLRG